MFGAAAHELCDWRPLWRKPTLRTGHRASNNKAKWIKFPKHFSQCLFGVFFGGGGFLIRLEQDTASRLFPMVLQHFAPSAPRVAAYARGRFPRSLPHRTDPTRCLRAGRSRGGAVQDLQAGPLQGALRSRPEDRGLHLLRGGGHQPAGQGQNLLRRIKAYL